MERLLARLERRFGRYAVPNLIGYVVGGMAIVWVLSTLKPEFQGALLLDFDAIRRGQVWRLVTFLFVPPPEKPIWLLVNLYFSWWVGTTLDEHWGAFKFNVYYLLGALGTVIAALIAGPVGNTWLDVSLFFAFATVFPEVKILLFFVLPIRVKWLGIVASGFVAYAMATGGWDTRAAVIASLASYALFFSGHWVDTWRHRNVMVKQQARRESMRPVAAATPDAPVFGHRVCAICGAQESDGADIRVCSCDKCGNIQRTLCLQHARAH